MSRAARDLARRLAEQRRDQQGQEFLAPLARAGRARLRLAGLIQELRVAGATPGWWICQVQDARSATVVREADPWQRAEYLALWPALRLVLVEQMGEATWLAVPFNPADAAQRFKLPATVALRLVEGGQPFDRVIGRVEGGALWYDEPDRRGDPAHAEDLRAALSAERADPSIAEIAPGERLAYALRWGATALGRTGQAPAQATASALARDAREAERLRLSLHLGGATLVGFERTARGMRVTWEQDGQRNVTIVDDRLAVVSAGICLSGRDNDFDLTSIVGVTRDAHGSDEGESEVEP